MSPQQLQKWFKYLCLEVWLLIAIGGSVRAMNAGLACPDWPLCFGDYIPDYHPQVYFEFIHRVLAGTVGLITLFLAVQVSRVKTLPTKIKIFSWLAVLLVAFQVVLGGLTVLLQLHDKVVAAHLALAVMFFSVLLWVEWWLREPAKAAEPKPAVGGWFWAIVTVSAVVFGQILLGGLVASNYAGLVCTDFPKCHGQWVPTLQGPIGLQVIHRFWAYTTFVAIVVYFAVTKARQIKVLWSQAQWLLALCLLQICIGIANVKFFTPPLITVLHLATAVTIWWVCLRTIYLTRRYSS